MADLKGLYKTTKYLLDSGEIKCDLRPYLGMSGLGHSCSRYLWYSFHWAYEDAISKRLQRLFQRGHDEEPKVIKLLEGIGYNIHSDQKEMVYGFGHVKGHIDGIVENVIEAPKTPHLFELKTASDSKFKGYAKINNLQKSHPVYYAQTQLYMHFLKLTRTLWIVVNKNDDNIHIERIRYNKDHAEDLLRKADSILMSTFPPRQPFVRTYFECKWCDAKDVCWNGLPMEKNCRTCKSLCLAHEGKWDCEIHGPDVPLDFQRKGCSLYAAIEQ